MSLSWERGRTAPQRLAIAATALAIAGSWAALGLASARVEALPGGFSWDRELGWLQAFDLVCAALAILGTIILVRATRNLADAPTARLDAPARARRDRAFRAAYYGFTGVTLTLIVALRIASAQPFQWHVALPGLFWRLLLLTIFLPAAAIAWAGSDADGGLQ